MPISRSELSKLFRLEITRICIIAFNQKDFAYVLPILKFLWEQPDVNLKDATIGSIKTLGRLALNQLLSKMRPKPYDHRKPYPLMGGV
jgi:hypothetical protein